MTYEFVYDERLGIDLLLLHKEWHEYSERERSDILDKWEQIRGRIPDRVKALEKIIIEKQAQLNIEMNFPISCKLNFEISELASAITDLHLCYQVNQDITARAAHH